MRRGLGRTGLVAVLVAGLIVGTQTAASSLADFFEPPSLDVPAAQESSDSCPWTGTVMRIDKFSASDVEEPDTFSHRWTHLVAHSTAPVEGEICGTTWRAWDKEAQDEVTHPLPPDDCLRTRDVQGEGFNSGAGRIEVSIGGGVNGIWHARVVGLGGEYEFPYSETRDNCGEVSTTTGMAMQFADVTDTDCSRIKVPNANIQAFRYTCIQDYPEEPSVAGYSYKRYVVTQGAFRRTACDGSVDTDAGGVSDCAEHDAGTDPLVPADDGRPTPTPTPTQTCPPSKPRVPALHAEAHDVIASREVRFRLDDAAVNAAGYGYVLAYGDGTTETIAPGRTNRHTYPAAGEYKATLVMTYPPNCVSDPRTFDVVADPATTYAPAVHLHPDEPIFPDTVKPFLRSAVLVHDRPNKVGYPGYLATERCPDVVLAAGRDADLDKVRSTRGRWTKVGRTEPPLNVARLGRHEDAYQVRERDVRAVSDRYGARIDTCVVTKNRYRAHEPDAKKSGNHKSRHDGLVLSLAGARNKVLRGDHTLARARLYVDLVPGRYVAYWLFYPDNVWRHRGVAAITERHEGDWERVIVGLDDFDGRMTSVAYYQHYCAARIYSRNELALENGTHPPVWPALGGHASYQKNVGRKDGGSCFVVQGHTDVTAAGGKIWRTWKPTAGGASRLVNVTDQPWNEFEGAWGDPRKATLANYGPPAPGAQDPKLPKGW